MNKDDILQSTKTVIQDLDALKIEHEKMIENIVRSSDKIEEKLDLLKQSMNMIDSGINEGQIMIQLINYFQNLQSEKHKLHIQIKRLCQENAWLRDELGSVQKKVHQCEQLNASNLIEIEQLKFLKDINDENCTILETDIDSNNQQDLMNDLFPLDVHDTEQDHSKKFDSPLDLQSPSPTDYEIPTRLKTLHNLVIQYASQGQYEIAVPLCRQALADLEKTLGHQHPDVATMLNILALVYRDQLKFKEACILLNDALSIREKTLGYNHPAVAATLNNLAVLYSKCNKYKEAEPLCKRALEIREKCLGVLHPDVAKQLNNLALLCQNQGKYDEVEFYYKRAIDIYRINLGENDLNVLKTKNHLASTYLKQQKYQQAEQLYKDILRNAYEKDSNISIENSCLTAYDTQNHWYKSIHTESPTITTTLKNLSLLYRRQGRYDAADTIENCLLNNRNDSQAIIQALNIVK